MMNDKLIGACGLYCGGCDNYLAFQEGQEHLLKTDKYLTPAIDKLKCNGCNSDSLSEHCSKCEIRKCAHNKGLEYCGACNDFPCDIVMKFHQDGAVLDGARHRLDIIKNTDHMRQGLKEWLDASERRWTCSCGLKFSYYEKQCHRCKETLDSYATKEEI
ncbi:MULTISPECIES: DUF3795 domain-containing protein [unclassified Fusibacter]|uniref:DUF3795 domain-containing protein n=1 Tax=unclassified Fusibacter TaxID=2624464 RepID=UPI0013E940C2|nr:MULTISPECIES: DUF3795 domain-containing protein [unclassified Fusibacter]MCK8060281.1 DUF3795 domain-containing protein [Fusibacter sp. A2]NPE20430.1 DUF3795 domain-containing protein [Fusibacter sp. A1]